MALPPKVPSYAPTPALATAISRVAYRGRATAAPLIEELNQVSVGTDSEWVPSEIGRVALAGNSAGKAKGGPGFSNTLARLASGYQANESPRGPQSEPVRQLSRGASGAYEMTLRVTAAVNPAAGNRHNRFY